jgi:hypothetical protein
LAREPALLDRPARPSTPPPLDWLTLADAFEAACLLRCMPTPAGSRAPRPAGSHPATVVEFNREDAAQRMRQLLERLDVPVEYEMAVGGLRRHYELHRLRVPAGHRQRYAWLIEAGWWQGRRELLSAPVPGASTPRRVWVPRMAAAAWRSALLAGGRHVRRHILGVRLTDRDLAAVLIRGASLLGVTAELRPGTGCFLVCVADGEDRRRILRHTTLTPAPAPAADSA